MLLIFMLLLSHVWEYHVCVDIESVRCRQLKSALSNFFWTLVAHSDWKLSRTKPQSTLPVPELLRSFFVAIDGARVVHVYSLCYTTSICTTQCFYAWVAAVLPNFTISAILSLEPEKVGPASSCIASHFRPTAAGTHQTLSTPRFRSRVINNIRLWSKDFFSHSKTRKASSVSLPSNRQVFKKSGLRNNLTVSCYR